MATQEDRERAINILSTFALEQAFNEWAETNWENPGGDANHSDIKQSDWEAILENVFTGNPFSFDDYENAVEILNSTTQDWGDDA